jgi:hypothetical protein
MLPGIDCEIGILIFLGWFLGCGKTAFAQDTRVEKEPIKPAVPLAGARVFKDYSAALVAINLARRYALT